MSTSGKTLVCWRSKANEGQDGLFWRGPLLLKRVKDPPNGFRELVVLPKFLRRKILQLAHDHMGHAGIKAMVRILRECVVWPGIYKDVSGYTAPCETCQKSVKRGGAKVGMVDTPEPFKQLSFDLVGLFQKSKKGYRYLLTCVCLATRYPEAVPLKTVTSVEV